MISMKQLRNNVIVKSYASCGYSMKEIADSYGLNASINIHYNTLGL